MNDTKDVRLVTEGLWLRQSPRLHAVTTDAVLLAAFARIPRGKLVVDLGCGNGPLGLLLLARKDAPAQVVAVDILPEACQLARDSAELSGLGHRLQVVEGDYRQRMTQLPEGRFGLVVCNPPYYSAAKQQLAQSPQLASARHELTALLEETVDAAYRLLTYHGRFALCLPPARLAEVSHLLAARGCHLKRLQVVYPGQHKAANLCLLEAVRGSSPGLQILPPLVVHEDDGSYTAEILACYQRFSVDNINSGK